MTKQSPHKRWKGCCMMCAGYIRGEGLARRLPPRDLRKIGKSRRVDRRVNRDDE